MILWRGGDETNGETDATTNTETTVITNSEENYDSRDTNRVPQTEQREEYDPKDRNKEWKNHMGN